MKAKMRDYIVKVRYVAGIILEVKALKYINDLHSNMSQPVVMQRSAVLSNSTSYFQTCRLWGFALVTTADSGFDQLKEILRVHYLMISKV